MPSHELWVFEGRSLHKLLILLHLPPACLSSSCVCLIFVPSLNPSRPIHHPPPIVLSVPVALLLSSIFSSPPCHHHLSSSVCLYSPFLHPLLLPPSGSYQCPPPPPPLIYPSPSPSVPLYTHLPLLRSMVGCVSCVWTRPRKPSARP